MKPFGLSLALLFAACSSPLDLPTATATSSSCTSHETEAACSADPKCAIDTCGNCDGSSTFVNCRGKADQPVDCGAPNCPATCTTLTTQAACDDRPDCTSLVCDSCGPPAFFGCYANGTIPENACPFDCPLVCPSHTSDADCSADPQCVSLFNDPGTCDCAGLSCCMEFTRCAQLSDGAPMCGAPQPSCDSEAVTCDEGYEPMVLDGCAIGCIHAALCTP